MSCGDAGSQGDRFKLDCVGVSTGALFVVETKSRSKPIGRESNPV
jgi:hypothetical protein